MLDLDAVASVVKSPTMIMVTRLCGRVLSERALRLLLTVGGLWNVPNARLRKGCDSLSWRLSGDRRQYLATGSDSVSKIVLRFCGCFCLISVHKIMV